MKKIRSMMLILLVAAFCGLGVAQTVFAAELPTVEVPVEIVLTGTLPEPAEDFVVTLKAMDPSCPMPADSTDGECSITIKGAGKASFPVITYDRVGVYAYTITQKVGENPKCTYEELAYRLTVYVTNAENGGLETTAILDKGDDTEKLDCAVFHNAYDVEPTETEPPTTVPPVTEPPVTPPTGDETNFALYGLLAVVSAGVLVGLVMTRKKKTEE